MKTLPAILVIVSIAACSTSAQPARHAAPSDVVATVGGATITLAQVDDRALEQMVGDGGSVKLSLALYDARRSALVGIVDDLLIDQEAKRLGIERTALIEREITAHIAPITDDEAKAWYAANGARLQGAPFDQVRDPIKAYLVQERRQSAHDNYIVQLKAKTPVKVFLDPPRQAVKGENRHVQGPKDAPIELVEFSDFQCPFCQRANPTVKQVLDTYAGRIRFVYRHYPLANHPNARPAAEASECAADQDKFWPFHDRLFAEPGKLADTDLKQAAAALGLDAALFNTCLDSHKYKSRVEADARAGDDAGVSGTPAFFINGRLLSGAQPFSAFKRIIDEELDMKNRG